MHIVVINRKTGRVEAAKVFDTYKRSDNFDEFISDDGIAFGSIIVAACMDDCITNMSQEAKRWFSNMGSKEI